MKYRRNAQAEKDCAHQRHADASGRVSFHYAPQIHGMTNHKPRRQNRASSMIYGNDRRRSKMGQVLSHQHGYDAENKKYRPHQDNSDATH